MCRLGTRFSIIWLFTICIIYHAKGQSDINFTSLTVKDGLSSNTVNAILKDKSGLVWFGTADGLDKFDGASFTVYRHQPDNPNSLSTNEVLSMYEDRMGNIWIGTAGGGVVIYDRKSDHFIHYLGDGSWQAMKTISARAFTQDHLGRIWIATYDDLRVVDPSTGRITAPPIKKYDKKYTISLVVLSLFEDSHRRMWVGTNQGLYLYNWKTNGFQSFTHDPSNQSSISNDIIKSITEDKYGNVWFGTLGGINQWKAFNHFIAFRHDEKRQSISNDVILAVTPDPGGKLWIGTEDGLNIFNPVNGDVEYIKPDARNIFSLKGRSIRSIFIDPQGIYWIGTFGEGIGKYNKKLALFNLKQSDPFDPFGLRSPTVGAFAECEDGRLIVGTGDGLEFFNKKTGLFTSFYLKSKLNNGNQNITIFSLYCDSKKQLWAGTYHDGLFKFDPITGKYEQFVASQTENGINSNDVTSMIEDLSGKIWIGTLGGGVNIYDPATGTFEVPKRNEKVAYVNNTIPLNKYVSSIARAPNGDIWIASIGTGIAVYHIADKSVTHYTKDNNGLADDVVQNIFFARDGSVWIGTNQGLCGFDVKKQKFFTYNERSGLANDFVKAILEDNDGLLWLSTDKGISSFNRRNKVFRNFTSENGVQQSSFNAGAAHKASNGDLYFGGQDGFNFFNPHQLPPTPPPGPVILTDLKVENASVRPGKDSPIKDQIGISNEITLKFGQNFSISYVSLDYTSSKQNRYQYRLIGFDKQWNSSGDNRMAHYTNLDPGKYLFQVRVSNSGHVWNNPVRQIQITVLPPFWRTHTAYVAYGLLSVTLVFFMRRRAINNIRRKFESEQEKLKIKQLIEQERREAEQLHHLDALKIKFLTDLSHEFRTPISLIAAPIEKLMAKNIRNDIATDLEMINRNVRRLLNLVNQLLDFRKMEENELRLNVSAGDIVTFIIEAAESFRDLALKKSINLEIKSTYNNWAAVFDHDKLERIIFNLLSNAFKFTPRDGVVTLDVDIFEDEKSQALIVLTITDSGVGIEKRQLKKIFERFYQPEQPDSILNQGTGLGLAITKDYVELQNGKIWADSDVGKGTKFFVEIPLVPVEQNETTVIGSAGNPGGADFKISAYQKKKNADNEFPEKKATILLVEDNDDFRNYLAEHLKPHYHIVEAANGKEGWQRVLSVHPQLVVSDISMPYMDGIGLSKKIKGDKRTCHVPVIFLTAHTGEEEQLRGLKSGASDFLSKPFSFQILDTKIANLLTLKKSLIDTYSKQVHITNQKLEVEPDKVNLLGLVTKYIEENLTHSDLSVEHLSKSVGMSRASLYYKILELTGLSPVEYIRSVKLEKAALLLEHTDYNVTQIAYMTGFATPSYFTKSFRAKFDASPSEYIHLKKRQPKK